MSTLDSLWKAARGFAAPCCPECSRRATLDEDGYFCEYCSTPHEANPAVDDIPNGSEFAEALARYQAAKS